MKKYLSFISGVALMVFLFSCSNPSKTPPVTKSADSARIISGKAWIYAYPMNYNYKTVYEYAIDKNFRDGAGKFNKYKHYHQSFTWKDTTIVTPNNDTPYSWAILELSTEPVVLSIPAMAPSDRYFCWQLVDMYTYNFAYIGTRTTGNNGGHYLIAGPGWKGEKPEGIDQVFMSESALVTVLGRIQLLDPGDLENIRSLQDQFAIMPLHRFLKTAEPRPVEYQLSFPEWDEKVISTPAFISYLNNYLQYTSVDPSEKALRRSFEKIGIIPGAAYDSSIYTPEVLAAIRTGIADAQKDLKKSIEQTHSSTGLFGTREQMKNDYMKRAVGAAAGIYGNTAEEAVYLGMHQDENGESLNGKTRYVLRIKKGEFPPCKYFWSVTMYGLPERHLVKNEIERYSIGDRTTGLKYENNGDLLIYIQAAAPGKDKMSNWLPAPEGAYNLICRIYGPEQPVLDGSWKFPFPQKVK